MHSRLKIAVVEENRARALEIIEGLHAAGWTNLTVIGSTGALAQNLSKAPPDMVLIGLANPSRSQLENLSRESGATTRPVAMFVDHSDDDMTRAAVDAGLSAYVVGDLTSARIKPVLETAIARFRMINRIRSERDVAKTALAERKTIDRAKGLLMQARGVSEDKAYALMRKTAMDQGRKVIDVADALVTASDLLRKEATP